MIDTREASARVGVASGHATYFIQLQSHIKRR
jgi:hypothetical protein